MSNEQSPERVCPKCGALMAADTAEGLCPACLLALSLATHTKLSEEVGPNGTKKVSPPPKSPPTPEDIASQFPQFEILECLGRGGMGVVYKARQKSLERLVALKILAPEREKDPQFAQRFAREAKTLAQLNHPSIVTVHDFGETDGMFYLVMEFVDGVNLRHLLKERKLSPEEALAIVPPVCEALQYAHGQGVIHRDIKPENLLLDRQGRIKIADFGIAKILGRSRGDRRGRAPADARVSPAEPLAFTQDQVIGTPQYMAPEQTVTPNQVDHRADIYSLGVVLYEMLTGELPAKRLQPPSKKVHVDVRIDDIVLRALEKEPERRYQTAEQFRTMVETIAVAAAKAEVGSQIAEGEQRGLTSAGARQKYNPWETTTIAAGTVVFIVLLLVALEEWSRPFRTPLIVMCIVGLGICAVSLAGLWPFPSPLFPKPNFSSRNLRHHKGSTSLPPQSEPRLSPTALLGGVLGITFVLTGVPFVFGLVNGPMFPGVFMILLGGCGMTLCGWVAITQIRHSAGKLYGLGLAVFDGLLFPLLALNAAIFGLLFSAGKVWTRGAYSELDLTILLLVTLLTGIPIGGLIIRRVWRWVNNVHNKPSSLGNASPAGERTRSHALGFGCAIAGLGGLMVMVLTVVVGLFYGRLTTPVERSTQASSGVKTADADSGSTWGPVIEQTLSQNTQSDVCFIDLDTDRTFAPPHPEATSEELDEWVRQKGIDAIAMTRSGGDVQGLVGWNMRTLRVEPDAWQNITSAALSTELGSVERLPEVILRGENPLPATFLFQTREGGRGILQITGFSEEPRGLRIRYRLAKETEPIPNREVHEVRLQAAQATLADLQARYRAGMVSALEVEQARVDRDVLQAQLAGDSKGVAEARLDGARRFLELKEQQFKAGLVPRSEMIAARAEVKVREIEAKAPETSTLDNPQTARVQLMEADPARRVWRWRVFRQPGTRMVYGVLDMTDPLHPTQVLMAKENVPLTVASSEDYTLRLNPEANEWRAEIETAWAGENGGRGSTWDKIDFPANARLQPRGAAPLDDLSTEEYCVFWQGDLVSSEGAQKRLRFVARLASQDDPVENILDETDPVRVFDEGPLPINRIEGTRAVATRRGLLFLLPLVLFGVLIGLGLAGAGVWWIVAGAKTGTVLERSALLLAVGGLPCAAVLAVVLSNFGIAGRLFLFPALLACEIPAGCLGWMSRQTGLGKAAIIIAITLLSIALVFVI